MQRVLLLGFILLVFSCTAQDNSREADKKADTSTAQEASSRYETASDSEHLQAGPVSPLTAGPLPHGSAARLDREMTFRSGSDKLKCLELQVDGTPLGWVHKAYRLPSELLLWQCVPFGEVPTKGGGHVEGVADHETVYIIDRTDDSWDLKPLFVPGFWYMSNESFCGERVAYWAYRNGEHSAVVYDFNKSGILARKSMGSFSVYSNDPEYFPRPEWDDSCSQVVFPKNYFLKQPEMFDLN